MLPIRSFLTDGSGSVSMDVVVLTAMLVGTSVAVVGTFSDGLETMGFVGPHVQLREMASEDGAQDEVDRVHSTFCTEGIAGLQAREDLRAAGTLEAPLDVADYMDATYSPKTAREIRVELAEAQAAVEGLDGWTVSHTVLGAVECELMLRGLD